MAASREAAARSPSQDRAAPVQRRRRHPERAGPERSRCPRPGRGRPLRRRPDAEARQPRPPLAQRPRRPPRLRRPGRTARAGGGPDRRAPALVPGPGPARPPRPPRRASRPGRADLSTPAGSSGQRGRHARQAEPRLGTCGKRGQCGLARPRVLAGASPAWVIVSREPSIEPCGVTGNRRVDASADKQARCKGNG
jgi:hypothetical protein